MSITESDAVQSYRINSKLKTKHQGEDPTEYANAEERNALFRGAYCFNDTLRHKTKLAAESALLSAGYIVERCRVDTELCPVVPLDRGCYRMVEFWSCDRNTVSATLWDGSQAVETISSIKPEEAPSAAERLLRIANNQTERREAIDR